MSKRNEILKLSQVDPLIAVHLGQMQMMDLDYTITLETLVIDMAARHEEVRQRLEECITYSRPPLIILQREKSTDDKD